ncbi:MAG: hypothetical protein ACOCP8_04905 [archaeon]
MELTVVKDYFSKDYYLADYDSANTHSDDQLSKMAGMKLGEYQDLLIKKFKGQGLSGIHVKFKKYKDAEKAKEFLEGKIVANTMVQSQKEVSSYSDDADWDNL